MVSNDKIIEIVRELKCTDNFKETCEKKSVKLVIHPRLLEFLQNSGVEGNKLINKLLNASRVKASYLEDKHPNFISVIIAPGSDEPQLCYLDLDTIKSQIRRYAFKASKEQYINSRLNALKINLSNYPTIHVDIPLEIYFIRKLAEGEPFNQFLRNNFSGGKYPFKTAKLGKGICKLFNQNDPKDVEEFVNLMKTAYASKDKAEQIEIVSGQDIQLYYHENMYANYKLKKDEPIMEADFAVDVAGVNNGHLLGYGCGELGNSCMRYDSCSRGIKFYSDNPDSISMMIYRSVKDPSRIEGRALLWKGTDGKTYIDRIYSIRSDVSATMASYAIKKEFVSVSRSNSKYMPFKSVVVKVKLQKWSERELPFFDTLQYLNLQKGVLSNYRYNMTDNFFENKSCSFDDNFSIKKKKVKCCVTGEMLWKNKTVMLDYGKHRGERCRIDKSAYILYLDSYVTADEVTAENFVIGDSLYGRTLIPKEDALKTKYSGEYIPESQAEYIPHIDDYAVNIADVFTGRQVRVLSILEHECLINGISYNEEMASLTKGKVFTSKRSTDKGMYVTHRMIAKKRKDKKGYYSEQQVFLVPFSALKLTENELQKAK